MRRTWLFSSAVSVVIVASAHVALLHATEPNQLVGVASVVDGDTLDLHGQRIRLEGIDAPESSQQCQRDGLPWRCGQAAAQFLDRIVSSKTIKCTASGRDQYKRHIAVCWVGDVDVNEALVRAGFAFAFRRYSTVYVGAEEEASRRGEGMWASNVRFDYPWDWRTGNRNR